MPRKIIIFENVSLDGFMAGPNGEIDWAIHDDEVTQNAKNSEDSIDTFMFGRKTYDMMASFWPTPAGKTSNPIFANALNNAQKIVFSKTLKTVDWQPTMIMNNLNQTEIMKLKQSEGQNIMIFGSGSIVNQLTNLNLIDEYQLMVNPIILGSGKPLFTTKLNLKLKSANQFMNGIVLLKYVKKTV